MTELSETKSLQRRSTQLRAYVLICCCLSAFLRIVNVSIQGPDGVRHIEDYNIAANIVAGNGFSAVADLGPTALKAPLYPFFLSLVLYLSPGHELVMAAMIQHVLISFCPLLLYLIVSSRFSSRLAFIAALALALHPSYWFYPSTLEATNLFIPLSLCCWYLVERTRTFEDSRGGVLHLHRSDIAAIVCLALVVLCQPLAAIPLFGLLISMRLSVRGFVSALLICAILWTPWTLRNHQQFGRFIPFKSSVWMNVYVGFDYASHGDSSLSFISSLDQARILSAQERLDDVYIENLYRDISLNAILGHPLQYAQKTAIQAIRFWTFPPRFDAQLRDLRFVLGRVIPETILSVGLLLSLLLRRSRKDAWVKAIAACAMYFTLVYAFTHTQNIRFKLDTEWLLIVPTCIVLNALLSDASKTSSSPTAKSSSAVIRR